MKVFLDDIREAPDSSWTVVRSYEDAISLVEKEKNNIELMSFDHDLGDMINLPEKTGYDVLLYIVQMKFDGKAVPQKYKVHSANPVGCERMQGVIDRYLNV